MADRKPFLLRIDSQVLDAVQRWANDDLRISSGHLPSSDVCRHLASHGLCTGGGAHRKRRSARPRIRLRRAAGTRPALRRRSPRSCRRGEHQPGQNGRCLTSCTFSASARPQRALAEARRTIYGCGMETHSAPSANFIPIIDLDLRPSRRPRCLADRHLGRDAQRRRAICFRMRRLHTVSPRRAARYFCSRTHRAPPPASPPSSTASASRASRYDSHRHARATQLARFSRAIQARSSIPSDLNATCRSTTVST